MVSALFNPLLSNTLRPVFQGALGATFARAGLHLYIGVCKAPEQRLTAWSFTLLLGCATGALLGVSASALLVGVAIHTLMLLQESASLIKFENFPNPVPRFNEKLPECVLGYRDLSVCSRADQLIPTLIAPVTFNGTTRPIGFILNANRTLSMPDDNLQFPVTKNPLTGLTTVLLSEEQKEHLHVECALRDSKVRPYGGLTEKVVFLPKIKHTFDISMEVAIVCKGLVYKPPHGLGPRAWAELNEAPSDRNSIGLNTETRGPEGFTGYEGSVYIMVNGELLHVPLCQVSGNLYLKGAWDMWVNVGSTEDTSVSEGSTAPESGLVRNPHEHHRQIDLSDKMTEEVLDRLGLTLFANLYKSSDKLCPGQIFYKDGTIYFHLPEINTQFTFMQTSTLAWYCDLRSLKEQLEARGENIAAIPDIRPIHPVKGQNDSVWMSKEDLTFLEEIDKRVKKAYHMAL